MESRVYLTGIQVNDNMATLAAVFTSILLFINLLGL